MCEMRCIGVDPAEHPMMLCLLLATLRWLEWSRSSLTFYAKGCVGHEIHNCCIVTDSITSFSPAVDVNVKVGHEEGSSLPCVCVRACIPMSHIRSSRVNQNSTSCSLPRRDCCVRQRSSPRAPEVLNGRLASNLSAPCLSLCGPAKADRRWKHALQRATVMIGRLFEIVLPPAS